jgi:SAM-dependent methyltransferase
LITQLTADEAGLTFSASAEDRELVLDLLLDGRRIWSLRCADAEPVPGGPAERRSVPWPTVLRPHLAGSATFTLRPVGDEAAAAGVEVTLGAGTGRITFTDGSGVDLVVNKWGRLGHALGDWDEGMVERLLDHVDQVRAALTAGSDLEVYVTSGTLLGPYRDGHLIPSDDDADLAYLSRHTHPVAVVQESFRLGRRLVAAGLTVDRFSAGHLQVHFDHDGRPDVYVDVFTGWIDDDGWWYQAFALRSRVRRDQLVPVSTIEVEGRTEPAPREPETMLAAIYGPGWRTPDPAFTFVVPPATGDRFWGWLSDAAMDRSLWEVELLGADPHRPAGPSDSARRLAEHLPPGSRVLELGAGGGEDALWLAGLGHRVDAVDYVHRPMTAAQSVADERGVPARFRALNLYDLRRVLALGAELAARDEPVHVHVHDLLPTLWDAGRPNLFRLLSMVLRTGGEAHLDVVADTPTAPAGELPAPEPLWRALPVTDLAAEMRPFGLHVREVHEVVDEVRTGPGARSGPVQKTRMVVSWQRSSR